MTLALKAIGAALFAMVLQSAANAGMVTVEFDLNVTGQYQSGMWGQTITPIGATGPQSAFVTFDTGMFSTVRGNSNFLYPGYYYLDQIYGSFADTSISSTLTSSLNTTSPYSNAPTTSNAIVSSLVQYEPDMMNYSQKIFRQSISMRADMRSVDYWYPPSSYERNEWSYSISLDAPQISYGDLGQAAFDAFDFTHEMLLAYLNEMKETGGQFTFWEQSGTGIYPPMLFNYTLFQGSATIKNIVETSTGAVSEPNISLLIVTGMLGLGIARRKKQAALA